MGARFWIRRCLLVFGGAFLLILAGQLLRGRELELAAKHSLIWGAITAAVFTTARIYQSRRQQHCAICQDTPETREAAASSKPR